MARVGLSVCPSRPTPTATALRSPFAGDQEFIDEAARAASAAGKTLKVHLKIDTGMGRLGCRAEEAPALAGRIASHKSLGADEIAARINTIPYEITCNINKRVPRIYIE
ncbi:hypothetical protein FACS189485_05090 [Spirochaetia bacterium]|nr:hypothetical protein FACS189485_05090 [Spirochaetia bacterium]